MTRLASSKNGNSQPRHARWPRRPRPAPSRRPASRSAIAARRRGAGGTARSRSPLITYTSMSPLPCTSASTIEPSRISLPARPPRLAHDDLGDVAVARVGQDGVAHRLPAERDRLGAELLGQPQRLDDAVARLGGQAELGGRLDVGGDPRRADADPPCAWPRAPAGPSGPGLTQTSSRSAVGQACSMACSRMIDAHLRVDALGGAAQRQLAQRNQVALAEEVLRRPPGPAAGM